MSRGTVILSVLSFIFGALGMALSLGRIITANKLHEKKILQSHVHLLPVDVRTTDFVFGLLIILSLLTITFSVLLFFGTTQRISGFILAYFNYGVFLAIIIFLSALLEFMQCTWYIATITLIMFGIYVYCLHIVYNEYNKIQKSVVFGIRGHSPLINEEQADLQAC